MLSVSTTSGLRRGRRAPLLPGLVLGLFAFHLFFPTLAAAAGSDGAHGAAFNDLLLGLVIVLAAAKLCGALFERFGQPGVLGELLAGIVLGNLALAGYSGLDFLAENAVLLALAELGVIILLFEVGLESDFDEMRRVGISSLIVAVLGVVAPMALGYGVSYLFVPDGSVLVHLFVGTTLCATSVGITARVLRDLGHLQRRESKIILGAAVIDDVLGLIVLAVVSGVITSAGAGRSMDAGSIAGIVGKAIGFLFGAMLIGGRVSPRLFRLASFLEVKHMLLVTSFGFCLLLAWLAAVIGLAPIVGAFAAGLILDPVHYQDFRDRGEHSIEELIHPMSGLLVPVFFVMTGAHVDLGALGNPSVLAFGAALSVAAFIGKQVCGLGVVERGLDRLSVGLGMVPRGEVGLIFATVGRSLQAPGPGGQMEPVISAGTFSAVIVMVMVTTLVTPPLLKWSMGRGPAGGARAQ